MPRTALGRGLSSLIREVETTRTGLEEIPINSVDPSPFQPRSQFSKEKLQELAESIRSSGVVQPILVRPIEDRFQLVAGERRWRAAKLAGLSAVPAVVRRIPESQAIQLALTENMMREDLTPLEVARGIEMMVQRFAFRHEEIAQRLGVDRSTVTNTLRLLKLPQAVQDLLQEGHLTQGHARALLALSDEAHQVRLARRAAQESLSVRQIENLVNPDVKQKRPPAGASPPDPNVRAAVTHLERHLGARVQVSGSNQRGKIIIWYDSEQDLDRIYSRLVGKAWKKNTTVVVDSTRH